MTMSKALKEMVSSLQSVHRRLHHMVRDEWDTQDEKNPEAWYLSLARSRNALESCIEGLEEVMGVIK